MKKARLLEILAVILFPLLFMIGCKRPASENRIGIYYGNDLADEIDGDAQVELTSARGIRVLVDVAKPRLLSKPPTSEDILLYTHLHQDHFDPVFAGTFPGKQLRAEAGTIEMADVKVKGIVASHNRWLPYEAGTSINIIYLIVISGIRLAHFGDTGQDSLTQEQLAELGQIDIAFKNFWANADFMFITMDQLNPRLIIPTHLGGSASGKIQSFNHAIEKWPNFKYIDKELILSLSNLPRETTVLIMGDRAKEFGKNFNIKTWKK